MAQPSTKLLAIFMAVAASGSAPPSKVLRPSASNSGLHFAIASAGPEANTPAVPAVTSSGRPIIGAATSAWPLSACALLDLADDRNAVGAGADMDAALGQRVEQPLPEHDVLQRGVVGQHGVDDVAVARGIGDGGRRALRPASASGFALSGVRL